MIKKLRQKRGYTQEEMAELLQISLRQYVRIDNEYTIPRADIFKKLIKVLKMNNEETGAFVVAVLKKR